MNVYDQIRRIERIDQMLRTRSTGTPQELAEKLGISLSQLYQILKLMKNEKRAPIYYSRADQSYCYRGSVRFVCEFQVVET
jgi:DNA-binding IclR family transcriptional regulator